MASYLRYSPGCIYRFQFRDRLGSPQHFCAPCHPRRAENSSAFYLMKLLIISCNPRADVEIHS